MKHIKLFKTQTEFDNSNTFLSIPNVSLISDTDKLIYNFEKTIAIGGGGNFSFGGQCYCSIDDLWIDEPVSNLYGRQFKTSQSFISNKKVNINKMLTFFSGKIFLIIVKLNYLEYIGGYDGE